MNNLSLIFRVVQKWQCLGISRPNKRKSVIDYLLQYFESSVLDYQCSVADYQVTIHRCCAGN